MQTFEMNGIKLRIVPTDNPDSKACEGCYLIKTGDCEGLQDIGLLPSCSEPNVIFVNDEEMKHKHSIETLHHFQCCSCKQWWTIGDMNHEIKELYCPACGVQSTYEETVC